MKAIEQVAELVRAEHPKAQLEIDQPTNPLGVWHLDATNGEHSVVVEWQPRHGFGVSATGGPNGLDGYGDGAHEHYDDLEQAAARAVTLLRTGESTKHTREVDLRRLRQRCEFSQER